jgi:hypothetical protein
MKRLSVKDPDGFELCFQLTMKIEDGKEQLLEP